jgi:hypothetical protein
MDLSIFKGKVHLTPQTTTSMTIYLSNYQLRQFTPQTTKTMIIYLKFYKNDKITLTKIKTIILKYNFLFKSLRVFGSFYRGNFVILLALEGTLSLF